MSCLSRTELAKIALGLEGPASSSAHLQSCARCQADLESMRSLVRQLAEAHTAFDQGHEQARARLLASLPATGPQTAFHQGTGNLSFPGSEH